MLLVWARALSSVSGKSCGTVARRPQNVRPRAERWRLESALTLKRVVDKAAGAMHVLIIFVASSMKCSSSCSPENSVLHLSLTLSIGSIVYEVSVMNIFVTALLPNMTKFDTPRSLRRQEYCTTIWERNGELFAIQRWYPWRLCCAKCRCSWAMVNFMLDITYLYVSSHFVLVITCIFLTLNLFCWV